MEVPNRLSLALAAEHGNDIVVRQKLNEWSTQVEFLCNPRPSYQGKDSSAAASASPASTAKNSRGTATTTENDSSPQSTGSTLQEEDPSSLSVVVLDTFSTDGEEELVVDDDSIVTNLSARLHYRLLESLTITPSSNGTIGTDHHRHVVDIPNYKAIQEFATTQIAAWKTNAANESQNDSSSPVSPLLASILRASKNWIRWYLQMYSAKVKRRHIHIVTSSSSNEGNGNDNCVDDDDDDPIHRFKSRIMLDFSMDLLNYLIIIQQRRRHDEQQANDILARHVALLLFYSTFDPIPPDPTTNSTDQEEEEQQHVDFFQNILNLLIHVDGSAVPLTLALMRNVHNAAAVYHSKKGALSAMAKARVVKKLSSSSSANTSDGVCPWAPLVSRFQQQQQEDDNDDDNDGHENRGENEQELTFTYLTVFCNMIAFCLRNQVPTPFPGSHSHSDHYSSAAAAVVAAGGVVADERAELVCEILRTLYASRIGQEQLAATSRSALDQLDQEQPKQPHLHRLILDLLQLDQNVDDINNIAFDNDQKHRIAECQLDTVSLLMDCGPGLMDYILASQSAADALLSLLDRQVECVLEQCSTTLNRTKNKSSSASTAGGDASAMLTPILVVVHRFCQSSPTFRRQAFLSIFPESAEANYQRLVKAQEQQERERQGNDAAAAVRGGRGGILNKKKKHNKMNMSPLDAPVDTKRWRMIQLLTCVPQSSHVKRFTGELLWLLCYANPQDFTHRVGLGNAMPILAVKGFAQLPTHTFP